MPTINVNGISVDYPDVGDSNWGTDATNFAIYVAAALGKIGQSDPPQTNDITISPGNLSVTSGNLSVGGTTTLTGNLTSNGNNNLGNASSDTTAITGILNVDSGVLYVDPSTNKVGINDTTPSEALDVTGNALISGTLGVTGNVAVNTNKFNVTASSGDTLIAGALGVTGAGSFTSNLTSGGIIYADDDTTANTPVISFTGDTNTGIGRSAADTLDFITNGNSRFRIEPTGQIKAVYESSLGADYKTTLHNGYLCRAWVNFNGTASQKTGTYSRTGTTITVNITSHGLNTGDQVGLDFTTGTATDGIYIVTVTNANSYTVTDIATGSTSGNVTQDAMIRASGNVSSITDNGTGTYTVNFTTAMPDVDYCPVGSCTTPNFPNYGSLVDSFYNYTTGSITLVTVQARSSWSPVDAQIINVGIFR